MTVAIAATTERDRSLSFPERADLAVGSEHGEDLAQIRRHVRGTSLDSAAFTLLDDFGSQLLVEATVAVVRAMQSMSEWSRAVQEFS